MKRLDDYSQYFLRSPALVKELIGHSSIKKADTVYDIGAGSGTISSVLATRAKKVVALEIEPRMAGKLEQNMARYQNVMVKPAYFFKTTLPHEPYKVFANIPFHISSLIVQRLVFEGGGLKGAWLIVQRQFAQKLLIERTSFTSQLGALIAPFVHVAIRRPLRRTDYWPHPNVDTVLCELLPREKPLVKASDTVRYRRFIVRCYDDVKYFRALPLAAAGLAADARPSQLSLTQWLLLFERA
jgi:16S rRNA A1518/A1519 N6-dimethyltransferase RsmA/KsgA/DIM1 with predicted DNA glycosylase/AP lyase activity